jgi:hypothetical protein
MILATVTIAGAQTPSDTSAVGELLGNGQGAGVTARFDETQPGAGGGGGGGGGGGDNSGITCRLVIPSAGGQTDSASDADLQTEFDQLADGQETLSVVRICSDAAGNVISVETIQWAPGTPTQVDPAVLAAMAREWLTFPTPAGEMTPPLSQGTVAQLPTFVRVENWQDVSRTATAGPVSATVTAHPVRQSWTIGGRQVAVCNGPGVAVEEGEAPPADACGWTPEHSSAGQRSRSESGEPCFNVTVTMTWEVSWTSNAVDGVQPLPAGSSQSTACVVVAEVQAVVSDGD